MKNKLEHRYCQSCGMPINLLRKEFLGTNADNSSSDEYCHYCLKNGEYTVDYTIQQMVDVWVKYTDTYNDYADTDYSPEKLSSVLNERLPLLKRWRQKKETENIHFETINRIQIYINQHLFDTLDTKQLSEFAGMSFYHFRKIFKTITNENIGTYIQRLRLEQIAYKLITTNLSIVEIINNTAIYTKYSLSKAFKKQFGIAPNEYRKKHNLLNITDKNSNTNKEINPRITRLSDTTVTCLQVKSQQIDMKKYKNLWRRLMEYAQENGLTNKKNKFVSISLDEPYITGPDKCRFYLGVISDNLPDINGHFTSIIIPKGLYAVFIHKGSHKLLPNLYRDIYLHWLPNSGYRQEEPLTFEVYKNTPREVPEEFLETEVYIPIG